MVVIIPKSNKMLADFKSRYMTEGLALSCKYHSPFAAFDAIFILLYQSNTGSSGFLSVLKADTSFVLVLFLYNAHIIMCQKLKED